MEKLDLNPTKVYVHVHFTDSFKPAFPFRDLFARIFPSFEWLDAQPSISARNARDLRPEQLRYGLAEGCRHLDRTPPICRAPFLLRLLRRLFEPELSLVSFSTRSTQRSFPEFDEALRPTETTVDRIDLVPLDQGASLFSLKPGNHAAIHIMKNPNQENFLKAGACVQGYGSDLKKLFRCLEESGCERYR